MAEIGGTDPGDAVGNGIQFDRYAVAGTLHFGGTLAVVAWNGFAPLAGQQFDLFDWGRSQGAFDVLDFAQAPPGGRPDVGHVAPVHRRQPGRGGRA